MKENIGIIGGGIAGITAGYLLNQEHNIILFEKQNRIGGNAYTHTTETGETLDIAVGSVLKRVAKNFLNLCRELNVKMILQPSRCLITMHDPETNKSLYLTPLSIKGLFRQKFSLIRSIPQHIKILSIINKSVKLLDEGSLKGITVKDMFKLFPNMTSLDKNVMMAPFCTLSSMSYEEVLNGPTEFFTGKMKAHGNYNPVLAMMENYYPKHFTKSYIDALSDGYKEKIILNSNIKCVKRKPRKVDVCMDNGRVFTFDKIIFACNADQALSLIENPTVQEKELLGSWKFKDVLMVVHKDPSNAPHRSLCQPWTCIRSSQNGLPHFSISYCTWLLCPSTSDNSPYYCTLNPSFPIKDELIDCKKTFRIPFYDFKSFPTVKSLPSLNGKMNSYFCGSYFGNGLHGDAVDSAIFAVEQIQADII